LSEEGKSSTEVLIENKTSGEKVIQMNVQRLKVNVRTGLLQLVFEYTLIEDWVFPIINKYVPELSFYATVQEMLAELTEDPRFIVEHLQRQKRQISPKIIQQLLNRKLDLRMFRLEGLLCYKFHRNRSFSMQ
jgi:flagellar biosynthesis component FlhA